MNILEQAKDEEFIKEQFVKGRILDDTKDYGRTQFVDEIYTLQQENQQLKDNWDTIKQEILKRYPRTERLNKTVNNSDTPYSYTQKTRRAPRFDNY